MEKFVNGILGRNSIENSAKSGEEIMIKLDKVKDEKLTELESFSALISGLLTIL